MKMWERKRMQKDGISGTMKKPVLRCKRQHEGDEANQSAHRDAGSSIVTKTGSRLLLHHQYLGTENEKRAHHANWKRRRQKKKNNNSNYDNTSADQISSASSVLYNAKHRRSVPRGLTCCWLDEREKKSAKHTHTVKSNLQRVLYILCKTVKKENWEKKELDNECLGLQVCACAKRLSLLRERLRRHLPCH